MRPAEIQIATEQIVTEGVLRVAEAELPTHHGDFRIAAYRVRAQSAEIATLVHGGPNGRLPLVRLHSECLTGDALGSLRCDCGDQLDAALGRIVASGFGALLYLPQEGRGIGLANKIRAYALQDQGLDTVDANVALGLPVDGRDYRAAADVLRSMGMSRIRLLTNNPAKCDALREYGIDVAEREPLLVPPNPANRAYLQTKLHRMGHFLTPAAVAEQAEPEAGTPA